MEHDCTECDWYGADNQRLSRCPKCGAPVTNHFDESPEPPPKLDDDWDDEDEPSEDDEDEPSEDDEDDGPDVGEAEAERADTCRDARRHVEHGD
jgi:predicted  nucleic acid-binding Zn-ribbon protein